MRQHFYLNIFSSKTAHWILTKLHRKDPTTSAYILSCWNANLCHITRKFSFSISRFLVHVPPLLPTYYPIEMQICVTWPRNSPFLFLDCQYTCHHQCLPLIQLECKSVSHDQGDEGTVLSGETTHADLDNGGQSSEHSDPASVCLSSKKMSFNQCQLCWQKGKLESYSFILIFFTLCVSSLCSGWDIVTGLCPSPVNIFT